LFIFGAAIYEFGSKIICALESNGDYGSSLYLTVLSFVTLGMTIAITALMNMYFWAEKQLKKLKQRECED